MPHVYAMILPKADERSTLAAASIIEAALISARLLANQQMNAEALQVLCLMAAAVV